MDKKIFKDIMREYDLIRARNTRKSNNRKKNLYAKYPRLQVLENELNQIAIKIARISLSYNNRQADDLVDLRDYNNSLLKEYDSILESLNLPANCLEVHDCYDCKDTGFIKDKKCKCFIKKLVERYYDISSLREVLKRENFSTFNINYYEAESKTTKSKSSRQLAMYALEKSKAFVSNFDSKFDNLLFFGPTGLGKTFLCNCIAQEILEMGKIVLYFTAANLFKFFDDNRFKKKDEDELIKEKMIFVCDLLIIDDLGTEYQTAFTSCDLFNIINTRILNQKPVIISTNLSYEELGNVYDDRIVSRLYGNYKFCEFAGDDIRLEKSISKIE